MIGIYKITSPSGKIYIGQSSDIFRRWAGYKIGCKRQPKLHSSFMYYGVKNHTFEIIETLDFYDKEILKYYEIFYWQKHIDYGFEMLNLKEPGEGGRLLEESKQKIRDKRKLQVFTNESKKKRIETLKKVIHTKEWNKKISNTNTGRRKTIEEIKSVMKSITQLDLNGVEIKKWECARYAARELKISETSICNNVKGNSKSAGGFKWIR
jgi:group I intron endonuclease